jgi:hypothetical protein
MRYQEGVNQALLVLGATVDNIADARERVVHIGVERPGVKMRDYERVLGPPIERDELQDAGPYEQQRMSYRLDLWPTLDFVVFGSGEGVAAGVRFERARTTRMPAMIDRLSLKPWLTVHSDIYWSGWTATPKEEWYPVLDVEVDVPSSLDRVLLQFDFGLLQGVYSLPAKDA